MVNPDRSVPSWVNKWLMINTAVLLIDGAFCVLRPHSLPGGCLENVFYTYKWYIQVDKHYGDPADSFIFTQGFGNLIEASVYLPVLFNAFKSIRLSKIFTIIGSVMTAYKTILYCLYTLDIGQGGREYQGFVAEFLIYGLSSVWVILPAYITWILFQDFVDIKPKGTPSRYSPTKADDSADGTGRRGYNLRNRDT